MTALKRYLLTFGLGAIAAVAVYYVFLAASRARADAPVAGAYALSYYESGPHDAIFLVRNEKIVVPPRITRIATYDGYIVGWVESDNIPAVEPIRTCYFVFDTSKGELESGLSFEQLSARLKQSAAIDLKDPREYWKNVSGKKPR